MNIFFTQPVIEPSIKKIDPGKIAGRTPDGRLRISAFQVNYYCIRCSNKWVDR